MFLHFRWSRRPTVVPCSRYFRPSAEPLEDRTLLTSYVVTTTKDLLHDTTSQEVTLRDIITAIDTQASSGNAAAGSATNTIDFAIGGVGSIQTINLTAALPALTQSAFIDGWSQGGSKYAGPPLIVLNGGGAGKNADGLELDAGSQNSTVRGLVIQEFSSNGIEIKGASGVLVTGNYLGTDVHGAAAPGNADDGVLLAAGASHNTIGGSAAGAGNVISGNNNGVEIAGAGTSANTVLGNLIGTDKTGTAALANVNDGILVDQGATGNIIGGAAAGAANVICGSVTGPPSGIVGTQGAVFSLSPASISGSIASFSVTLNYTDAAPEQMVYLGIDPRKSSSALVTNPSTGQPDFSAFNFIPSSTVGSDWGPVGNAFPGEFLIHTPPSTGGQPAGLAPNADYFVGTLTYDLSKFAITPSSSLFVSLAGGGDTVIGAEVPGEPATFNYVNPTFSVAQQPLVNVAVTTAGVEVSGAGTSGNQVLGNLIGVNSKGTVLGHLTDGVLIDAGATQNMVGGTAAGTGNVIAGNNVGVVIGSSSADTATVHDTVLGNSIFANVVTGIALGNQASTTNSVNPRTYPNDGQNAPAITMLTPQSVGGSLSSVPNTTYRLEFFANPVGGGSGQTFLGFLNVKTGATGSASFTLPIASLPHGDIVTATATNLANGDTSGSSPVGTQVLILTNPTTTAGSVSQVVPLSIQVLTANGPATSGRVTITIAGIPGEVTVTPNGKSILTVNFPVPAGTKAGQYSILATVLNEDRVPEFAATGFLMITGGVARRWAR